MIIAKNEQMKKVLGLGYPSAPVYTVEEFGEKQMELMQRQSQVHISHSTVIEHANKHDKHLILVKFTSSI